MARKNGVTDTRQLLDQTRAAIAKLNDQIAELSRDRDAALLAFDRPAAVELINDRLCKLRRDLDLQADRLRLLEAEEQKAAVEQRVLEKLALIERIEAKLGQRQTAALEIAEGIAKADKRTSQVGRPGARHSSGMALATTRPGALPPGDRVPHHHIDLDGDDFCETAGRRERERKLGTQKGLLVQANRAITLP